MKPHRTFPILALAALAAASASSTGTPPVASEHGPLVLAQSEFRRGLHDAGEDRVGRRFGSQPPSVGGALGGGSTGGLGEMRGRSLGNYGAGSIGERGPGGLGALRGDSVLHDPPRPR